MQIKSVDKSQAKVQTTSNINSAIQSSRSTAASLAKETAVFNQTASISVSSLNKSLQEKGADDALLDAAKDSATQDEYLDAKEKLNAHNLKKAELQARGTVNEVEGGDDEVVFDSQEDAKEYAVLEKDRSQSIFNKSKQALENNKLNMKDTTFTSYGKAYQQKARVIGLNRVMIDLDVTSTELAIEHAEDPIAYAQAMTQYRTQVKEQLPEQLHAAYDSKALVSQNTYSKQINKNVTKIQDQELAATSIQKLDLTRTNLLNSASSEDKAGYISAKQDHKDQLQLMVNNRLITQAKADDEIRSLDSEATELMIMTDFETVLAADPAAAQAYLEVFASSSSEKLFGLSKAQAEASKKLPKDYTPSPLDIEYDTLERNTMVAKMQKSMNNHNKAVSAQNSKNKTDNDKFAKDERALILSGKTPSKPLTGLVRGVNISTYEYDQLAYARQNKPLAIGFDGQPTLTDKESYIAKLKEKKEYAPGDTELIEALEERYEAYKSQTQNDPGAISNDLYNQTETFGPKFDVTNITPYLDAKEPTTMAIYYDTNAPKNLLSNAQASQYLAYFNELGPEDTMREIYKVGASEQAEMLFDQLGKEGDKIRAMYNLIKGNQNIGAAKVRTMMQGHDRLKNKETSYNEQKINIVIAKYIGTRFERLDGTAKKGNRQAIIDYALGANPDKFLLDADDTKTKDMIKEAIDAVMGKEDDSFFGNTKMVLFNKTSSQVKDLVENVNAEQVKKTIPANANFYTRTGGEKLSAKMISEEIALGKIKLVGSTGIEGEYILKRNNQYLHTEIPTGKTRKDGYVYTQKTMYRFKLWSN